jgi:hypothetical protein
VVEFTVARTTGGMVAGGKLKKTWKLLRPFTGTGAIFFPIGKPPLGTCEQASELCIEYCYAKEEKHPNGDDELRITQDEKWRVYWFITERPFKQILEEIQINLDGLQTYILHWFGSGDCPAKDVERISDLIQYIKDRDGDIIQMGFTRNKSLWGRHKEVFALTVETEDEANSLGEGVYAIPDYTGEISIMYSPDYTLRGGRCGPTSCRDTYNTQLEHLINCQICHRLNLGCFDRRRTECLQH